MSSLCCSALEKMGFRGPCFLSFLLLPIFVFHVMMASNTQRESYIAYMRVLAYRLKVLPCDLEVTGTSPGSSFLQKMRGKICQLFVLTVGSFPRPSLGGDALCTGLPFYIAYTGDLLKDPNYNPRARHEKLLEKVLVGCSPQECLLNSYGHSFNGFAARLTTREKKLIATTPLSAGSTTEMELAHGSGKIDLMNAVNPGLIYDAGVDDYVKLLCSLDDAEKTLYALSGGNITCSAAMNGIVGDLNYPSFALLGKANQPIIRVFHRTLTNVGLPMSDYQAVVSAPAGLRIEVDPAVLSFSSVGEKRTFMVTVNVTLDQNVSWGSIVWVSKFFSVRSPVVVYLN